MIQCYLIYGYFATVNQIVNTTVWFIFWWLQHRSNVALFKQLLRQQLSYLQKITALGTSSRIKYWLWNVNCIRWWCWNIALMKGKLNIGKVKSSRLSNISFFIFQGEGQGKNQTYACQYLVSFTWLIDWFIDWCLTPTLAILQQYRGVNKFYY